MSDDATRCPSDGHSAVWSALKERGYAITNDSSIGLPDKFRPNFHGAYYPWTLHHDDGDWPIDRLRARDVIRYHWRDWHPQLQRHDEITITNRAGIPGKREHTRVELLADPHAEELITALLQLVPPSRRQLDGTFGVNLFRTFTNVVTKPHRDNEQFIIIYVLDRIGTGAETYLYNPADVSESGVIKAPPLLRQRLDPGDIIIFEDALFKHGATPLRRPAEGTASRDVLICTVDDPGTYLQHAS